MKTVKILIVANNCEWATWREKILALKFWYKNKVDLFIEKKHTSFEEIPMMVMSNTDGISYNGVESGWYDNNIVPLAEGYDMVMLVLNLKQWKQDIGARGWRTDADHGPIKLQVGCDELERTNYPQFGTLPAFYQFARHEIMHGLYMLNVDKSLGDRTHYWWNIGRFENALDDIEIGENLMIFGDIKGFITRFLASIYKSRTTKWADAIQEFEGYIPGSKSYRNNNPGNLRFTGYTSSLGAMGKDPTGFAVFGTYQEGYDALNQFLSDAKSGKLISYRVEMSLNEFFEVYAPSSDNNAPEVYASFVAKRIGVSVEEIISNI
jgi:hypothetical protein